MFIGGTFDKYLRAFNAVTGEELWQGRLPAAGLATPMTYTFEGRQYVVIAAGGRRDAGVDISDTIVAFSLPAEGEAGPSPWSRTVDRPGGRFKYSAMAVALLIIAATALVVRTRRKARVALPR